MCLRRPKPPAPPEPEPVDSPIEATAETVTVGKKRPSMKKKSGTTQTQVNKPKMLGTRSLQIPLLTTTMGMGAGNLKYPT